MRKWAVIPRAKSPSPGKRIAGVLVLEPAAGLRGAVKTARKGVGEYTLRVQASRLMLDSIRKRPQRDS